MVVDPAVPNAVPSAVPHDTSPEIYAMMVARWRTMSVADRVELVTAMCADVERLAIAGITGQHPEFSEVQIRHALATRRYGSALADAAYEELLANQ